MRPWEKSGEIVVTQPHRRVCEKNEEWITQDVKESEKRGLVYAAQLHDEEAEGSSGNGHLEVCLPLIRGKRVRRRVQLEDSGGAFINVTAGAGGGPIRLLGTKQAHILEVRRMVDPIPQVRKGAADMSGACRVVSLQGKWLSLFSQFSLPSQTQLGK